jgi:hypothetical protein
MPKVRIGDSVFEARELSSGFVELTRTDADGTKATLGVPFALILEVAFDRMGRRLRMFFE